MKKIVICALLLCLILTACGQITPQEQLNGVLNTTTGVTTISTTEPKTDLNINEGGELPLFACYSWDEYIKFVSTTTLPDDFVLYEELRQIGNFQSLILLSYLYYGDFSSYLYGFEDEEGKMNRSLLDVGGEILSVSQFTLYGDTARGRRPSFTSAAKPGFAEPMYEKFNEALRERGVTVETGVFGAMMDVSLINDGPVTLILEK